MQRLTKNCRIKNLDDFERDEADAKSKLLNVNSRTFKRERERNDHMLNSEQVFSDVSERRESKCWAVLMKHRHKIKGEQVILQMDQQLKTKGISDVPGQLFCCQILTMNSLNVKHQDKSSNQLAFHLPAYTRLRKS